MEPRSGVHDHLITSHRYDTLDRRIQKRVANSGSLDTVGPGDFFYYDGNRVIEYHKTTEVDEDPLPPGGGPEPEKRIAGADEGADGKSVITVPGPVSADSIYERLKEAGAPGSGKQTTVNYADGYEEIPVELVLKREFVYGLDYIDEPVAVFTDDPLFNQRFVFQGERSEREWAAIGKVKMMFTSGPRPARRE